MHEEPSMEKLLNKPLRFYQRLSFRIGLFAGLFTGILVFVTLFVISSFASDILKQENLRYSKAISELASSDLRPVLLANEADITQAYPEIETKVAILAPRIEGLLLMEVQTPNKQAILRWTPAEEIISFVSTETPTLKKPGYPPNCIENTISNRKSAKRLANLVICVSKKESLYAQSRLQQITSA